MITEEVVALSEEELKSLTSAIKSRYGIDFTNYETKSLTRGFTRLMLKRKINSVLDLWSKILKDRVFFMSCIDDLTVNLTELFRNPEIWVKLKQEVLPKYKLKPNIRMWHAGCSSGEEVYTMAIVLKDGGLLYKSKTLATDLSTSILAKAMEGSYSALNMEKYTRSFSKYVPNGKMEECFTYKEDNAIVKDELRKHIEFKFHNLVQDGMEQKFDIIFCRNVMIYFDDTLKIKVLQLFHKCLEDDGFFVLGYYDILPAESKTLFEVYDSTTRIYRKIKA